MATTGTTADEVPLTTGWDSGAPISDTMLRRFLHHHAESNAAFTSAAGGRVLTSDSVALADYGRPSGYFNGAILLAPPPADRVGDLLDEVEGFFSPQSGLVGLWTAWDLGDLRGRGWELSGHPPLLVRPPAAVMAPPEPPAVDVRPVTDAADLALWERVAVDGYPFTELAGYPAGSLADPRILEDERASFWLGRIDGRPVSIGTMFEEYGIASLTLGVTLPEARRKGFWLRHAVDRLTAVPDIWTAGIFSDMSRPGAESLGFVPINRLTLWLYNTGEQQ